MIVRNLNRVDRILRFALAFWWLGPLAPQFESPALNLVVVVIAWIALIESFVGWCPLHALFGVKDQD